MALTAAPVERRSWRSADDEILPEPTVHHTGSAPANPSQLPDKIQPPPAARLFCGCSCRIPRCRHWMGNSQTSTTLLAHRDLWRILQCPGVALFADGVLYSVCDSARRAGYRRRLGHTAEHDHRLVRKIQAPGSFRS